MAEWFLQVGACSPVNGQHLFSGLPGGRAGMEEGLRNSPPCSAQSGGGGARATGGTELGGTPEPQGAAQARDPGLQPPRAALWQIPSRLCGQPAEPVWTS